MRNDLADITILLDRSGSMKSVADATVEAVNGYISSQSDGPGVAVVSLIEFDGGGHGVLGKAGFKRGEEPGYWQLCEAVAIQNAPKLVVGENYIPRHNTPLLDAIGRAITNTATRLEMVPEAQRPATVLFVIQTDGYENASREFSHHKIQEMITKQRDYCGWDFVFLGAGIDAISSAAAIGIQPDAAIAYNKTAGGTANVFAANARNTKSLRAAKAEGNTAAKYLWKPEDRQWAEEE